MNGASVGLLAAERQFRQKHYERLCRSEPGLSAMERSRFIETMLPAGFPICAKAEALAKIAKPVRLPECEAANANPMGRP
jgi:hypothetical protein